MRVRDPYCLLPALRHPQASGFATLPLFAFAPRLSPSVLALSVTCLPLPPILEDVLMVLPGVLVPLLVRFAGGREFLLPEALQLLGSSLGLYISMSVSTENEYE